MGCLGVHFALDEDAVNALKSRPTDESRLEYFQEELEEEYFAEQADWIAETDKAWDAIHRSLTDGHIGWDNGAYPLNHVILGGELLYGGDDYIMSLKNPSQVKEIAEALRDVNEEDFRTSYFSIDPDEYGFAVDQEDYEYTWSWFTSMRELYYRAAAADRYVLFTASQ